MREATRLEDPVLGFGVVLVTRLAWWPQLYLPVCTGAASLAVAELVVAAPGGPQPTWQHVQSHLRTRYPLLDLDALTDIARVLDLQIGSVTYHVLAYHPREKADDSRWVNLNNLGNRRCRTLLHTVHARMSGWCSQEMPPVRAAARPVRAVPHRLE